MASMGDLRRLRICLSLAPSAGEGVVEEEWKIMCTSGSLHLQPCRAVSSAAALRTRPLTLALQRPPAVLHGQRRVPEGVAYERLKPRGQLPLCRRQVVVGAGRSRHGGILPGAMRACHGRRLPANGELHITGGVHAHEQRVKNDARAVGFAQRKVTQLNIGQMKCTASPLACPARGMLRHRFMRSLKPGRQPVLFTVTSVGCSSMLVGCAASRGEAAQEREVGSQCCRLGVQASAWQPHAGVVPAPRAHAVGIAKHNALLAPKALMKLLHHLLHPASGRREQAGPRRWKKMSIVGTRCSRSNTLRPVPAPPAPPLPPQSSN